MSDESTQSPNPGVKLYCGHEIHLKPNWEFYVTGPEFIEEGYVISFLSAKAARDEIDKRLSEAAKIQAQNINFRASVLTVHGRVEEIRGINRRSAKVNLSEGRQFYPFVPWIQEALLRQMDLWEQLRISEKAIEPYAIDISRGYGSIAADEYPQKIKLLQEELKKMTEAAKLAETRAAGTEADKLHQVSA